MIHPRTQKGFSLIELLIVVVTVCILAAVALPQLIGSRRALLAAELPKQIASQLRFARQEAMSRRRAFSFVYNDTDKTIQVIGHTGVGTDGVYNTSDDVVRQQELTTPLARISDTFDVMDVAGFPFNGQIVRTTLLRGTDFESADLVYGNVPSSTNALSDGTTLTPTAPVATTGGSKNLVVVTFQPDGRVVNSVSGTPVDTALFFYNNKDPKGTASAISVLGGGGRVRIWRYNANAAAYQN